MLLFVVHLERSGDDLQVLDVGIQQTPVVRKRPLGRVNDPPARRTISLRASSRREHSN